MRATRSHSAGSGMMSGQFWLEVSILQVIAGAANIISNFTTMITSVQGVFESFTPKIFEYSEKKVLGVLSGEISS